MNNWFPKETVRHKREKIAEIIRNLAVTQNPEKKFHFPDLEFVGVGAGYSDDDDEDMDSDSDTDMMEWDSNQDDILCEEEDEPTSAPAEEPEVQQHEENSTEHTSTDECIDDEYSLKGSEIEAKCEENSEVANQMTPQEENSSEMNKHVVSVETESKTNPENDKKEEEKNMETDAWTGTISKIVEATAHRTNEELAIDKTDEKNIVLYTARSQHAEIENSHSQRGKSEQALLKLYSNFFSHPPEAR